MPKKTAKHKDQNAQDAQNCLKDKFENTCKEEFKKAKDPTWKEEVELICGVAKGIECGAQDNAKRDSLLRKITVLSQKSASELNNEIAKWISDGIRLGKDTLILTKKQIGNDPTKHFFVSLLQNIQKVTQKECDIQAQKIKDKQSKKTAIETLCQLTKLSTATKDIEEVLENGRYFYKNDKDQKIDFDLTDEHKAQLQKQIDCVKQKLQHEFKTEEEQPSQDDTSEQIEHIKQKPHHKSTKRKEAPIKQNIINAEEVAEGVQNAWFAVFPKEYLSEQFGGITIKANEHGCVLDLKLHDTQREFIRKQCHKSSEEHLRYYMGVFFPIYRFLYIFYCKEANSFSIRGVLCTLPVHLLYLKSEFQKDVSATYKKEAKTVVNYIYTKGYKKSFPDITCKKMLDSIFEQISIKKNEDKSYSLAIKPEELSGFFYKFKKAKDIDQHQRREFDSLGQRLTNAEIIGEKGCGIKCVTKNQPYLYEVIKGIYDIVDVIARVHQLKDERQIIKMQDYHLEYQLSDTVVHAASIHDSQSVRFIDFVHEQLKPKIDKIQEPEVLDEIDKMISNLDIEKYFKSCGEECDTHKQYVSCWKNEMKQVIKLLKEDNQSVNPQNTLADVEAKALDISGCQNVI